MKSRFPLSRVVSLVRINPRAMPLVRAHLRQFGIAESQVERRPSPDTGLTRPDQKVSYVVRLFSDGPREYDFLLKIMSLGRDYYWRKSVVREARMVREGTVLDIACGTGLLTYQFAASGARVIGVDVTREMLARASNLNKSAGYDVDFIQARAENLPIRSEVFDATTISLAMRNVSSQTETLDEMRRCTKSGRKIISLDFARPKSSFFKPFYYFYIFKLLPTIGLLISRHWNTIFLYLANSIEKSRDPEKIMGTMRNIGLSMPKIKRMTHGTTAIVSGTRWETDLVSR